MNCTQARAEAYDYGSDYLGETTSDDEQAKYGLMFKSYLITLMSSTMLEATTRRKDSSGCTGNILNHTCYLSPSVMLYDISLQGEIATLRSNDWRDDTFVETA